MMKRVLAVAGAVALLASGAAELAAQRSFGEVTDVVLVEIPVQVERDGKPVRGLTKDDFEVREGRKKQEIVGFEMIDLDLLGEKGETGVDLPVSSRRHFLFLFDLSLSDPAKVARAQAAAAEFAADGLHPSDLAAVATYSSRTGITLVLGFTSDRAQLEVAVRSLGLPQLVNRIQDPLSLTLTDLAPSGQEGGGPDSRGIDAEAEIAEVVQDIEGDITVASRRNQMLAFTAGLGDVARILTAVDGQKHVVLLSEGFDASGLVGRGVQTDADRRRIAEVSAAAAEGRIWEVGDDERFASTTDQGALKTMTDLFVQVGCSIHSVDIGGARAGGAVGGASAGAGSGSRGQDGLFMMANQTGGSYHQNFNRLDEAMGQVLERTSVTYLLAIQPENLERDGSFHRLKIKLKNEAKGTRLVHRPGYFAPKPAAETTPLEKRLNIAGLVLGGEDGGSVRTAVLAAPYDVQSDVAYVPVLIEIDGQSLLEGVDGGIVPTEIYVYGFDASGSIVDYFTRALGLDVGQVGQALRRSGLKYWGHLELPPGDYQLRVVVRNDRTGRTGVRKTELSVPDVLGGEAALWPAMAPEPQGKWLLGREKPEEQGDFPYPFLANGQPFIPAARPAVAAGQELTLVLAGYHLGAEPSVSASLVRSDGTVVDCEVALEGAGVGGEGPDHWLARLSTGSAAPGDYTLVLTAAGSDGGSETSEIAFVVEG